MTLVFLQSSNKNLSNILSLTSDIVSSCADGNCIHMVDNGIVQKLMDLLDRHVEDGNVTVQHAALSALRNLAIPGKPPFALLIAPM